MDPEGGAEKPGAEQPPQSGHAPPDPPPSGLPSAGPPRSRPAPSRPALSDDTPPGGGPLEADQFAAGEFAAARYATQWADSGWADADPGRPPEAADISERIRGIAAPVDKSVSHAPPVSGPGDTPPPPDRGPGDPPAPDVARPGADPRDSGAPEADAPGTGTPEGGRPRARRLGIGRTASRRAGTAPAAPGAPPDAESAADQPAGPDDDDTQQIGPLRRPGPLARTTAALAARTRPGRSGRHRWPRRAGAPADAGGAEDAASSVLARLTALPALLLLAWLLPGLPLLLAREFVPVPQLLIAAPLLVGLIANGLRVVPSRWPRLIPGQARDRPWMSWFGLMATVAVAAGFAAWQLTETAPALIVLRSPGAYLQAGYWLAQHGSLPVPVSLAAFGGAHPGLSFSSTGFYAHGASVVPGGTSGLPLLLAGGFWAHGTDGAAALGAVLGGLAVLSFGGLVARLAGPQWAPAGALVLGLTLPEQYVSRSAFAETALQILLFGGLCLLTDALTLGEDSDAPSGRPWLDWLTPRRCLAGLAGLALGAGLLVSLDAVIYLLPVIPFGGLLVAARRAGGASFCIGVAVGAGYGVADGYVLSRPFLDVQAHAMELVGIIAAWLAALTVASVQLARLPETRRWLARLTARRPARWLAPLAGGLVAAALIGLAVRPYVQVSRHAPGLVAFRFIAALQRAQGLPVDPSRTYAEDSLYWVIWYLGLPAVLLGGFSLVLLARSVVRSLVTWHDPSGAWRSWALPLAITCAGSAAVLWYPGVLPDQPWASRRLVVVALPGLIVAALWAAAWLTGHARGRGARPLTASVAGLFCVAALAVPAAATATGAGLTHSGRSGGLRLTAPGLAFRRTGAGEVTAVDQLCSVIPQHASVVILDSTLAQELTQVIRGTCGVPAAWMTGAPPREVSRVLDGIARAGRRPVLLGSRPGQITGFGGTPDRVADLTTTQDPHQLTSPPVTPATIRFVIWMVSPQGSAAGT